MLVQTIMPKPANAICGDVCGRMHDSIPSVRFFFCVECSNDGSLSLDEDNLPR